MYVRRRSTLGGVSQEGKRKDPTTKDRVRDSKQKHVEGTIKG